MVGEFDYDDLNVANSVIDDLRAEVASLKEERSDLVKQDFVLAAQVKKLHISISDLTQQLADTQQKLAAANERVERIREAIQQTLYENGNLADGDNCTLILLKRAISDLTQQVKSEHDHIGDANGMMQESDGVGRDAERYRWLRKQHWDEADLCVVVRPKEAVKLGHDCPSLERLDEVIDASMLSEEGE